MRNDRLTYAVVIPCHNEENTVGKVVEDFKKALPEAEIYVIDNASCDQTCESAIRSGARIIKEPSLGKGNAVRRMGSDITADVYILVDGDDTYWADDIHKLMEPVIKEKADMVIGARLYKIERKSACHLNKQSFCTVNWLGNWMISWLFNICFQVKINDLLSGYRVLNRRLVLSLPMLTTGFEIETEITLQAIERQFKVIERPVSYDPRPKDSYSKLKPFRDGYNIILTILLLLRDYRPLTFFGSFAIGFFLLALWPAYRSYFDLLNPVAGVNLLFPVATGTLLIMSLVSFIAGLIIGSNQRRFRESELLFRNFTRSIAGSEEARVCNRSDLNMRRAKR